MYCFFPPSASLIHLGLMARGSGGCSLVTRLVELSLVAKATLALYVQGDACCASVVVVFNKN